MKKVTYLSTILIVLILMSFGCDKDETNVSEPKEITVDDLLGDWNFYSLEIDGKTTYDCDAALNQIYDGTTMSILNVRNTPYNIISLYNDCMDAGEISPSQLNYEFRLINNEIDCAGDVKFDIVNVDSFDGTVLVVKMTYAKDTALPIGGTFTLKR